MIKIFDKILLYFISIYYNSRWNKIKKSQEDRKHPRLFWGTSPILNFSIWSNVMKSDHYSKSFIFYLLNINKKQDFDYIISEMDFRLIRKKGKIAKHTNFLFEEYLIFDFIIHNFDIFFISYEGFNILKNNWKKEIDYINNSGGKIVVLSFGADNIQISNINSFSFKHAYLTHYPQVINKEKLIIDKTKYLNSKASIIVGGGMLWNKIWNILSCNYLSIDIDKFERNRIKHDCCNVVHSPNHRFLKGTEYIIKAIDELRAEGYSVKLILLENIKNDRVIEILNTEADILVEQLLQGYALSGIEGMAAGLPVLSNLDDNEIDRKIYRRFSFLNECPILSTNPENVKENIKLLILNPSLRNTLGKASRAYVEKYHSKKSAQYMFNKIIDKIWYNKDIDLMNIYHPLLNTSYNNQSPIIKHPLKDNKIPEELLTSLVKS